MTKSTKAELIAQILTMEAEFEREKSSLKAKVKELETQKRHISDHVDHYREECDRLSESAKRYRKDSERYREKHGDLVVTAQNNLLSTMEIMSSYRSKIENRENSHSYVALQHSRNHDSLDPVSFDERVPF